MKNLLSITAAALLLLSISCSTDETTSNDTTSIVTNTETETTPEAATENYAGVFTTSDGQTRGTLGIMFSQDNSTANGTLTLSDGEVIAVFTDQITDLGDKQELDFTSSDLSFTMTTGEEGEIMEVDTVIFKGDESAILMGKSTTRAPLNPILGTYLCTMCPAPLDNTQTQSFNLLMSAPDMSGNSVIASQTTLGGTIYNGIATQSGCIVNGNQTTCNLNSGTVAGITGTAFNPGGGPVTWSGIHTFNNEATGPNDCSTVSGTWSWDASTIGLVMGNFNSNTSGDCPPPPVTLIFENFETAIGTPPASGYVISDGVTTGSLAEFSEPDDIDYFGRVTNAEFPGGEINISNVQGNRFFGAFDMDGGINSLFFDTGAINWFNIDVSGINNINISAFIAEDDDLANEDWDPDHSVRFETSTDNTTWTPVFAIESISASSINLKPHVDTNFDGVGDGAEITDTMVEYTSIDIDVSAASTISVRIIFENLSTSDEDIAIDNFRIIGF